VIISFIGVDGSGKTTLARKVKNELRKRGYSVIVIKPFRYLFLSLILKFTRRAIFLFGDKTSTFNKKSSFLREKNKYLVFKLWPLLALIDHWFYFMFKIRPLARKYDYLITDRFFFDFASSYKYFGYTTEWLDKIYLKLIPKPDLTFVLDLKPELAFEREKGDVHTLDFFQLQRVYYLELIKKFKLERIDSSKKTEELEELILKKIGVN